MGVGGSRSKDGVQGLRVGEGTSIGNMNHVILRHLGAQYITLVLGLVAYLKAIAEHEMKRRPPANSARVAAGPALPPGLEPGSDEPTPSQVLLTRELLERDRAALAEIVRRLSREERAIWELVRQELKWPDIARKLGGTSSPEAVRKVFARAVRRIADELKMEGHAHE